MGILILKFLASLIGYGVGSSYLKKKEAERQAERNKEIGSCCKRAEEEMKRRGEARKAYWESVRQREELEKKNKANKENDKKC